jgi:CO/xanthine dehydrogenase Mo-binding subunit
MADPRVKATPQPVLAQDRVRYVGEPVAVVVAESRYRAEDAAEAVQVAYEPLDPVVDVESAAAMLPLHEALTSNEAGQVTLFAGEGRRALDRAPIVARVTLRLGRVVANPMEPRAVLALYDRSQDTLTVYAANQGVFGYRRGLAAVLGFSEDKIHVIAPDVGGGFGVKNRVYPEDALAAALALRLGRPVRWTGDRHEEFLSTNQERDQVHHAAIGLDRDGHIIAVVDDFLQDNGAYTASGMIVLGTTAISVPGPYRIPHLDVVGHLLLTNKVPLGPYRGAGRPQGNFVMERLLDAAADRLGVDRVWLRRQNLLTPADFPYQTAIPSGRSPLVYDHGDFPAILDRLLKEPDVAAFADRKRQAAADNRRRGLGIALYLEFSGGAGGFEDAVYRLTPDGSVEVSLGSASQGQGHETALAQIAAEGLNLPMERIHIHEGDTAKVTRGVGTFGSRTMVVAGNAVLDGADRFRQRLLEAAAERLEAAVDDLVWESGTIRVRGVPERGVTLADLAAGPPLVVTGTYEATRLEYSVGAHAAEVELDPATGQVTLVGYWICHDEGRVVNPLLADGQTIGGTVQGLGTVLYEELIFDRDGQPQNTSLMEYLLPGAGDMPTFRVVAQDTPSTGNPAGFKGLAEGGTIPPMAAVLSAVEDAARPHPLFLTTLPLTPSRLWAALHDS